MPNAGPGKHPHTPTHEEIALEAYYEWEDRIRMGGEYFGESKEDWSIAEVVLDREDGE